MVFSAHRELNRAKTTAWSAVLCLLAFSAAAQSPVRMNTLPRVERLPDQVVIRISPRPEHGAYFLHYRTEGMTGYQVRKMQQEASGAFSCRIAIANLYGKDIEFRVVEKKGSGEAAVSLSHTVAGFTRQESPEIYFQEAGDAAAPARRWQPPLNVNASLSTATKLDENNDSGYYQQNYTANGNLRIYKNIAKNDTQIDFDTNFNHLDPWNEETENRVNLSSMMVRFKKGAMQIEAGDVAVNATEFTTSYLNRRGLRFEYAGKSLYLNSFYTNSQQKTGFDGYGIPDSKAGIFGAVAGFNLKNTLTVRGLVMTGRDNLVSKTVYSADEYRKGSMFSLWSELSLLRNSLQVTGEISSSTYGAAASQEEIETANDTAWKAGLRFQRGILSFSADYEDIGDHFQSIANLFLQNDREGLSTNLGLSIKSFSWNLSYVDKKNYMNNPLQDMLHQRRAGTTLNWGLGRHFRVGADVSRDNLDYDSSTGLQTSTSDMNTYNYSASLGYMAGATGVNLNVGRTESVNFSSNLTASLSLNLRFGKVVTLNPTLSFQENEALSDGSKSTVYNAFVSSEITFIPQYLTLTVSSSYMSNEGALSKSASWTAGCNLNFFAAKLFKDKVRPSLSLKSMFQGAKTGDIKTDSSIFHLQADIAF